MFKTHTRKLMMRMLLVAIGLCLFSVDVLSAGLSFPGPDPGIARARMQDTLLILENDILSVRWDLADGLHLSEAIDKSNGQSGTTGRSECLKIIYYKSPSPIPLTVTGSQMVLTEQPVIKDAPIRHTMARRSEQYPGKQIVVHLVSPDRNLSVRWQASLRDGSNYVRQTVELQAGKEWVELNEIILLDLPAEEAVVHGSVDGSPAVAGRWFMGLEHPMSKSQVVPDARESDGITSRVRCSYPFAPPLAPGGRQQYSTVLGLVPKDQLRRGFLYYLERERAHPYRPHLNHSVDEDLGHVYSQLRGKPDEIRKFGQEMETWWQGIIEDFGRELVSDRKVVIDSFINFLWDDSGNQPWQFVADRYPEGFAPTRLVAEKYGASLGVWFCPDAYTGTRGRVPAGIEQKFEGYRVGTSNQVGTMALSLAGPRYYGRFRAACVNMVQLYGVNFFKFDGLAEGYKDEYRPSGPGPFASDVEALIKIYAELRQLKPDVFINASTGSWPSPFWLRWADCIWHQGPDVGPHGPEFKGWSKGSPRQRWLTYRDSATFHNGLERGPLYPLNSYMLHGLEFNLTSQGFGRQRVRGLDTKDIVAEIRSYFGTGTNLQEMYTHPSVMTPKTWDTLAEAANWSRANAHVLVDTHWVGGDPAKDEVYGWASWTPRKGILTLRNPDDQAHLIRLDIAKVFELPEGAAQNYRLKSPWQDQAQLPAIEVIAGRIHEFKLQPFEVLVFDATPVD